MQLCLFGTVCGRLEAVAGRYAETDVVRSRAPESSVNAGLSFTERVASSISTQQPMSSALQRAVHRQRGTEYSRADIIGQQLISALQRAVHRQRGTEYCRAGGIIDQHAATDVVRSTARSPTSTQD
jgi:hypothetical protein